MFPLNSAMCGWIYGCIWTYFMIRNSCILYTTHTHTEGAHTPSDRLSEGYSLFSTLMDDWRWRSRLLKMDIRFKSYSPVPSSHFALLSIVFHCALYHKRLTWFTSKDLVSLPSGFHLDSQWRATDQAWREVKNEVRKLSQLFLPNQSWLRTNTSPCKEVLVP